MNHKEWDVIALGELLVDLTENGLSNQGNLLMEANPGGAPCNVLSMLSRLGRKTAFIGKVGADSFGTVLKKAVLEQGIDGSQIMMDPKVHTTLAVVLKKEDGDRDFAFYRKPGADIMLNESEVDASFIKQGRIFHFGSCSLSDEPCRSATKKAVEIAKREKLMISFDPNLREPLWNSLKEAQDQIDWGLKQCDLLKISDNEIAWFTQEEDYDQGIEKLKRSYPNLKLIALSLGPDGSRIYTKDHWMKKKAFLQAATIETTGAGDTFWACVLDAILSYGTEMNLEEMTSALTRANAAASIITTRKGALRVMPTQEEIDQFLLTQNQIK